MTVRPPRDGGVDRPGAPVGPGRPASAAPAAEPPRPGWFPGRMPVRPPRDGDVDRLAVALARAFHDDPVTRWVYASERRRPHWSARFFAWQLRRLMPQDVSWTTEDGAGGAALWALPGRWRE